MHTEEKLKTFTVMTFLILTVFLLFPFSSIAVAKEVGTFTFIKGNVDVLRKGETKTIPAVKGDTVYEKDIVRSKSNSRAHILLSDGSKLNIAQKSRIEIKTFEYKPKEKKKRSFFRVFRGKLRAIVSKLFESAGSSFEVETPTAVAAVRGTDFILEIPESPEADETVLAVFEGKVSIRNKDSKIPGELILEAGETTTVGKTSAPSQPRRFSPSEGELFFKETGSDSVSSGEGQDEVKKSRLFKTDKLPKNRIEPPVTPAITESSATLPVTIPVTIELTFD